MFFIKLWRGKLEFCMMLLFTFAILVSLLHRQQHCLCMSNFISQFSIHMKLGILHAKMLDGKMKWRHYWTCIEKETLSSLGGEQEIDLSVFLFYFVQKYPYVRVLLLFFQNVDVDVNVCTKTCKTVQRLRFV